MSLSAGTRLGPYEILSPLGAGGMGVVYKARDTRLDRTVAVKVLPQHITSPEARQRFEREARSISQLSHPNVCALYDVGREGETDYLVMELLEGESLADKLLRGPLPLEQALSVGADIARALDAAHRRGIVHRDLKPGNVMLTRSGVKLLDFGLAKPVGSSTPSLGKPPADPSVTNLPTQAGSPNLTQEGTLLGTFRYMAPEQLEGREADSRTDIFALGALLYEMVTGEKAFEGKSQASLISSILRDDPAPISKVVPMSPPALDRVVKTCLAKDPDERWQSAADVARELKWITEGFSAGATPAVSASAHPRPIRRTRWVVSVLAAAALLAAFLAGRFLGTRDAVHAVIAERFEPVTDRPGEERRPRLSPDGKSFVFVSDAEGNDDIYIQRVGGRAALNLTKDSPVLDGSPAFSSDGALIAFHSAREGGGVFVMGATGESVRRVTERGFDPDWSPDGKELAVSTEDVARPNARSGISEIWAVDVATGKRRLVFSGDGVEPRWSPGGHRIAFWGLPRGTSRRDIWTVAADGSQAQAPVPVVTGPEFDWGPAWSPDGRFLYFSSDRGGSMNLWRVSIDERSGKVQGNPQPVTVPSTWAGQLSFSSDGTLALFSSEGEQSNLQVVPFDPVRERVAGPPETVLRLARPIANLDWSPDGKALVLCVPSARREDLYIVQSDGTGYRQITDAPFFHRLPRWSPDGTRIAFASNRGGTMQAWTIGADGSGLMQVTDETPGAAFPTWSPDGERLAVVHTSGQGSAALIVALSKPKVVERKIPAFERGTFAPYSWSRDGRVLAGSTFAFIPQQAVFLYSLSDNQVRRVASGRAPVWMLDGRRLLFQTIGGGIAVVDTQGGRIQQIVPDGTLRARGGGLEASLSSDDRKIAYVETHREGDVWLIRLAPASSTR